MRQVCSRTPSKEANSVRPAAFDEDKRGLRQSCKIIQSGDSLLSRATEKADDGIIHLQVSETKVGRACGSGNKASFTVEREEVLSFVREVGMVENQLATLNWKDAQPLWCV